MTETTEDAPAGTVSHATATAEDDGHLARVGDAIVVASTVLQTSRLVCQLLQYVSGDLSRRTERITRIVTRIADELHLDGRWEFEAAARLSQIGSATLGRDTLDAVARGDSLDDDADRAFASHPLVGRDLLAEVRRLEAVGEMIARQREPFTVAGLPPGARSEEDRVTLGGQLLRVAVDAEALMARGAAAADVVASLQAQPDEYNQDLVRALGACLLPGGSS